MLPTITIFCAFTRFWSLEKWIENFKAQDYEFNRVNFVAIVDADEPRILVHLKKLDEELGFRDFRFIYNEDWQPNEVRIAVRRQRIVDIMNMARYMIEPLECEYVIGFEDDTVFEDTLTIQKLLEPFVATFSDGSTGFVEGVQCGRWGVKMIGAWEADDYESPTYIKTLLPQDGLHLEPIDAGGLYGYCVPKDLFISHEFNWNNEPWGPDVNFGLWIKQQGYKCLVNWDLKFGHNDHNKILWPDSDLASVEYTLNSETNIWQRSDTNADSFSN